MTGAGVLRGSGPNVCPYAGRGTQAASYAPVLRRLTVTGRSIMDPDEPRPIDQQIDGLVAVLLQEKPELDRARTHAAIRETVERLLKGG